MVRPGPYMKVSGLYGSLALAIAHERLEKRHFAIMAFQTSTVAKAFLLLLRIIRPVWTVPHASLTCDFTNTSENSFAAVIDLTNGRENLLLDQPCAAELATAFALAVTSSETRVKPHLKTDCYT